jgi:hypothetical protein
VLTEHRAQGEFVAIDTARHPEPWSGPDEAADHLVAA